MSQVQGLTRVGEWVAVDGVYQCPHCLNQVPMQAGKFAKRCKACSFPEQKGWTLVGPLPDNFRAKPSGLSEFITDWIYSIVSKFRKPFNSKIRTTVSLSGIVTSFIQKDTKKNRVISTTFHPMGCYQIAIFEEIFGQKMLGYKLASNQVKATECHVTVVSELLNTDPISWDGWTTTNSDAVFIMANLKLFISDLDEGLQLGQTLYDKYKFQFWDDSQINQLLADYGLPRIEC